MSQVSDSDLDRLLDQIVTTLREDPIPEFSDPLAAAADRTTQRPLGPPMPLSLPRGRGTLRRWSLIAAATATAVGLIFFVSSYGPNGESRAAFAQVQEAVAKTKSMSNRCLDFHGDRDPYVTTQTILVGVGSRSEGPNGFVSIRNQKARRSLWINNKTRTAGIQELYPDPAGKGRPDGFLEKLRDLPASGAKNLGTTVYDGKKVLKFAWYADGDFVVFVDTKTHLPIRMELKIDWKTHLPAGMELKFKMRPPKNETFREVITDYVFDAPVDESLFDIKIPAGYAVTVSEEPKDRKPVDTSTWVASVTKGLGPVPRGASKEQILAALGTPDLIEPTYRGPDLFTAPGHPAAGAKEVVFEDLDYSSLGFSISVSRTKGMTGFTCFGRLQRFDSARDFLGKTDGQIALGASIDDVVKAYGKPEVKSRSREDMLHYFHKGWTFIFRDGKLAWFSVSEPLSENIEVIDTGDGGWLTGVKQKQKTP
jgi:hypothetical protein